MAGPSYDECLVEAELRARAAYSEPHRGYHDERHLDECLVHLDEVGDLDERERRILRWAILWHDAVYELGRRDNEERSAELAKFELARCGIGESDAEEVARLIRATERHRCDPGDRLGRLMICIDLAILGSDEARYDQYASDIRREYAHVAEPMWRTGRAIVLQRLLEADPLYPDPQFRERFEERARDNMESEIRSLAEG